MSIEKLRELLYSLLAGLHGDGQVAKSVEQVSFALEDIVVERPRDRNHGDWATNVALKLSKQLGYANPRALAEKLVPLLENAEGIKTAEIAGPGFINITLDTAAAAEIVSDVLKLGADFGRSNALQSQRINLEFVSANPTGPLHIGGARWAAVGDALARILEFAGAKVEREYYFNDHGAQIDNFARSLYAAANGNPAPEDGYAGQYIAEIATDVVQTLGKDASEISVEEFREIGVSKMFPQIKTALSNFGVHFDTFFHEQSLYDEGKVQAAIEKLRKTGDVYEKDGATWIATSKYGDDKDRVVIKSDGTEAYFAADVAYYLDKRERADKAVYMLGADHGGYIGRLYAVARAFGDEPKKNVVVLLGQLVNLKKGGEPVKMSKRAGNIITLDDLVDAVGNDAARYSLERSSTDTTLDLDLDLLSSHKLDNPVYYVQYAYARTRNVLRNFEAILGTPNLSLANLSLLNAEAEEELLAKLAMFESVAKFAAEKMEPHRIARYLEELSASYHSWYAACRITGDNVSEDLALARIALNEATAIILRTGLDLLGVNAPEKM